MSAQDCALIIGAIAAAQAAMVAALVTAYRQLQEVKQQVNRNGEALASILPGSPAPGGGSPV